MIPDWFWKAVETPSEEHKVEVDECDVAYRTWGDDGALSVARQREEGALSVARQREEGALSVARQRENRPAKPGLLFIHGMNAHSHWWDFIAPSFIDDYRVAAMDLTGMGDSDFRYEYDAETYALEINGVLDAVGFDADATVVAHSFGGYMSVRAANLFPDRFGSLVLVDSGIRHPDDPPPDRPSMGGRAKVYPDRETALGRFRLQPPQPCENTYILEYIAKHSLLRVDGGWAWKFDEDWPTSMKGAERRPEEYRALKPKIGVIYGEKSELFSRRTLDYMRELIPQRFPAVAIPDAQHHVFLDKPLEFVAALTEMLTTLKG